MEDIFFLYTDHKPLLGLLSELKGIPSMAAARIQCWPILLSAYNCTLKYHSGIENSNVDFFNDAIPMTNITSAVIDCLRSTFSIHRILYFVVSDNGPSLTSEEFKKFCKLNGMKYLTIAPYHPSSNGAAERSVQTFKTSLKKIIEGKPVKDLNAILQRFLLTYRTTPHCTTHTSPAELLFRRKLNTRLSFINPTLLNTINSHGDNFRKFHHYSKGLRQFYPGDKVWIRDYGKVNKKWIEGQVIEKISDAMYNVKINCSNLIVQKHVDQLRYMPLIDDFYEENDKHELKSQIEINEQYNNNNEYKLEPPEPAKNENESNPVEPPTQDPSFVDNENEQLTSTPVTNQLVSPIINNRPK